MTKRELATVLAALRYWQMDLASHSPDDIVDVGGHFVNETPLTSEEIDQLCEELNFGAREG